MRLDMKKNKETSSHTSIKLLIIGVVVLASSPLLQYKIAEYLTKDCPFFGSHRVCSIEIGLKNAFYAQTILSLWIVIGVVILIAGMYMYFAFKKAR
jgi:hypothetical protein